MRTSTEWGALSGDLADIPATDVNPATPAGVAALSTRSAAAPVVAPVGAAAGRIGTLYRVPVDVIGRAVDTGFPDVRAAEDDDTTPRLGGTAEQPFGPPDDVDELLPVDRIPALPRLFPPRRDVRPPRPMELTQVFPVLSDGLPSGATLPRESDLDVTRVLPAVPAAPAPRRTPFDPAPRQRTQARPNPLSRPNLPPLPRPRPTPVDPGFLPMSGVLPMSDALLPGLHARRRSVPAQAAPADRPSASRHAAPESRLSESRLPESGLRDLPPVPTLPRMPTLPGPHALPGGRLGGPGPQDTRMSPAFPAPRPTAQAGAPGTYPPRGSGPFDGPPTAGPGGRPGSQDAPAGAAEQLMSQLRGLISELEASSGPLDALDEPEDRY